MLEGWGRLVHRRRWLVLAASLLLLGASGFFVARGGDLNNPDSVVSSESGRASALLNTDIPRASAAPAAGTSFVFLFESDTLLVTDAAFQKALVDAIAPLRADPRVQSLRTYYDAPAQSATLLSRDQHATLVSVTLRDFRSVAEGYWEQLRATVRSDTLRVLATGSLPINYELDKTLNADLQRAEVVSLPFALILLVLVFGTIVGALVPIGVGVLAIVGGIGGVFALSHITDVSPYSLNIVTLVGLGTAIDYSLFIVARYREELSHGASSEDALARAMGTAGRAVVFSGITVAIGLSGMLFFEGTFLSSLGVAGAIVVAVAVLYALTFLPALLAILGSRVNAWGIPRVGPFGGRSPRGAGESGLWHRLAMGVMRRPLLVLLPTVAFVIIAGSPFLEFRLANAGTETLPPQAESRQGYDALIANFPGQEQSTITAVAYFPGGDPQSADHTAYVKRLSEAYARLPNVLQVRAPFYGQHIAVLQAVTSKPASSDDARDLVRTMRGQGAVTVPGDPTDGEILITGATAFDLDTIDFVRDRSVRAVLFVIAMTLIALFLLLRSFVLPIKAVVMNLLSITASFGAIVWIFEQGHLAQQLNFTPQSLDPAVPVILFCIVFGLSMDYEVLLLSRIQEDYERTGDNTHAVALGLERSGRLITAAALIMVAVFVGFALADVVIIKSVGVGMAVAVALDATLVRALIVPATMRLLGRANWWAPSFARRRQQPAAALVTPR
ncbi:MAG TPA: MMPL family transporter [Candidatus Limnocylindrales bacterium]|nr:MMPL family transporter [Candidatus Limnocylindrales bacterium]